MRHKALTRKSPIRPAKPSVGRQAPRKPLPPKNAARATERAARVYSGPDRVTWIQAQPSVASGKSPCVNAHVGPKASKGMGYKAGCEWVVPLTQEEHDEWHDGQQSFEAKHNIDLQHWAAITAARYDAYVAERER